VLRLLECLVLFHVDGQRSGNRGMGAMLTTRPLRSHKKMAEQVRDAVSTNIREHGLKAGDRIPTEAELCAAFGVSRPSVREALRLPEPERLVVTEHGRGRLVTAAAALNIARPITVFESISQVLPCFCLRGC